VQPTTIRRIQRQSSARRRRRRCCWSWPRTCWRLTREMSRPCPGSERGCRRRRPFRVEAGTSPDGQVSSSQGDGPTNLTIWLDELDHVDLVLTCSIVERRVSVGFLCDQHDSSTPAGQRMPVLSQCPTWSLWLSVRL
jgi:hypothetical protein